MPYMASGSPRRRAARNAALQASWLAVEAARLASLFSMPKLKRVGTYVRMARLLPALGVHAAH